MPTDVTTNPMNPLGYLPTWIPPEREKKETDLSSLNPQQMEAVTTTEGPIIMIAGAGAGKTHTLMTRVAYLINNGIDPESILLMTFTNAAANDMKKRAIEIAGEKCNGIKACTYHSFCSNTLRHWLPILNKDTQTFPINENFTVLSESEKSDIISIIKTSMKKDNQGYPKKGMPSSKTLKGIISEAADKRLTIESVLMHPKYEQYHEFLDIIKSVIHEYQNYKMEHNLVDFDDMLQYMILMCQTSPDIAQKIGSQYKYIMIDEYQDTNTLQDVITQILQSVHKNVCVVGDDYQSIYAFRGSDIDNFLKFGEHYPGAKQIALTYNYRSTQEILDLANDVMAKHADFSIYPKYMASIYNSHGQKPCIVRTKNQRDEAEFILHAIRQSAKLNDNAVIYRNSTSATTIEHLLVANKIPYNKMGGVKFFDHDCVQDIIAFLRVSENQYDHIAWYRILKLNWLIGKSRGEEIANLCKIPDFLIENRFREQRTKTQKAIYPQLERLHQVMDMVKKEHTTKEKIETIMRYYKEIRERNIEDARQKAKRSLDSLDQAEEELENDLETIKILPDIAEDYPYVRKFLDSIALDATKPLGKEEDCVVLTTVHSAKGLEWKNVFLLDVKEDVFPRLSVPEYKACSHCNLTDKTKCINYANGDCEYNKFLNCKQASEMAKHYMDEELRCFYVAITRPKENLYILCPDKVRLYGKEFFTEISRFLVDSIPLCTEISC